MKTEYNLSTMKRRGHPLRDKVSRGELVLINPLDIPNKDAKVSMLPPDEQTLVIKFLETFNKKKTSKTH